MARIAPFPFRRGRSDRFSTMPKSKHGRKSDEERFIYWSMLPEDLRVEILCRLKSKQLIRLKCVSKSWHLLISNQCAPLISSSRLCGIIMTKHMLDEHGSYLDSCYSLRKCFMQSCIRWRHGVSYLLKQLVPFKVQPEELQDCCNGVLLIANLATCPRQYYVCNLTTRQCIEVPVNTEHYVHTYNASLVFDPRDMNSPNSFMVLVPREYSKDSLKLDVFSSCLGGNWSFCTIPLDSVVDGSKLIERSVYLNGTLYMLSMDKYLVFISLSSMLGKRTTGSGGASLAAAARAIELPGKGEFDLCGSFGASKGDLVYSNSDSMKIMIWVLENDARWILKHRISVRKLVANPVVRPLFREYCQSGGLVKVCAFHPYSEKIFVVGGPRTLQMLEYNPRNKKLKYYHSLCLSRWVDNVFPVSLCAVTLDSV